jgi:uncharacterized short protein YbdD (DUF466 family)
MKARKDGSPALPASDASRSDASRSPEASSGEWGGLRLRSLCSACRQVFGIPDYERYLAHAAERHPGAPVLARGAFCVQAMERRYGQAGARCC